MTISEEDNNLIRESLDVRRREDAYREEAEASDDPVGFLFTARGRDLDVRLAQARVMAALEIARQAHAEEAAGTE